MTELTVPDPESTTPVLAGSTEDGRVVRGRRTRDAILDRAVQIASVQGLEGLTIGGLATELGVSKSGLFAHFGSKTELQLATVDAAREIFIDEVIWGSREGAGVGRLLSLTDAWLSYLEGDAFSGGCFFAAASIEFDGRPGPVRDRIASVMAEWLLALDAAIQDAQDAGELARDIDSEQLAFEINSLGMGANWANQLFGEQRAFARAREAIHERFSEGAGAGAGTTTLPTELPPLETVDEGAARRSLREQIAKLERELAALFSSAYPHRGIDWQVAAPGGPRVLGMGDLEALRDDLATRIEDVRRELRGRSDVEHENRGRLEALIADPAGQKWVRISNEDIGDVGCKYFHSRPRLGLVGMLMGWWRVKISSGCP